MAVALTLQLDSESGAGLVSRQLGLPVAAAPRPGANNRAGKTGGFDPSDLLSYLQ